MRRQGESSVPLLLAEWRETVTAKAVDAILRIAAPKPQAICPRDFTLKIFTERYDIDIS